MPPAPGLANLTNEGEGLPPDPLGAVPEPNDELADETQPQRTLAAGVELLQHGHDLREASEEQLRALPPSEP